MEQIKYKQCSKCGELLSVRYFYKNNYQSDGYHPSCKVCKGNKVKSKVKRTGSNPSYNKEYKAEYYQKNKIRIKERSFKHKFKVPFSVKRGLWEEQGRKCYVCKKDLPDVYNVDTNMDHNHSTGRLRRVLCNGCNAALGLVRENKRTLKSLIDYLEKYK